MKSISITSVESPCVRRCTLNEDDLCVGCGRSLEEIRAWSKATHEEQQRIVVRADERLNRMRPQ